MPNRTAAPAPASGSPEMNGRCSPRGRRGALLVGLILAAAACGGPREPARPTGPNIVVFLLDAARADHFGAYGYGRPTTPHVDALAAEGIVFESAVSEAASTFPSTAALMTGRSPSVSGLLATQPIPDRYPMLAERVRAAGYRTYGYSENPFITGTFRFDRGFDRFDAVFPHESFAQNQIDVPEIDTEAQLQRAVEWMQAESRPFFAYFHILRPHNPYLPPAEFLERLAPHADAPLYGDTRTLAAIERGERQVSEAERAQIIALYDANLAYGDALFGSLMAAMSERGLLDDTAVVVLSDHGEGFLEHGHVLHTSTVYDEMIRVAAVARLPGIRPGTRVAAPLQLRDIGNALARLAGAELPADEGRAFELASETGGRASSPTVSWTLPRFARAAVRSSDHKLIVDVGADGCGATPLHFFELASDPRETHPRPPQREPAAAELADHFRSQRAPACGHQGPDHGADLDPALAAQLRALGYIE